MGFRLFPVAIPLVNDALIIGKSLADLVNPAYISL